MQQDAFKALKIVHLGITGGLLIFAGAILFLFQMGKLKATDPSMERTLQVVAVICSVALLLIGFNLFKRKMMEARNSNGSGAARMALYRTACIIWWAMIEAPGLLAVVSFFITGNYAFLALAGFHVLVLLLFMPRKDNIIVLLNLNTKEVAQLEGKS
jgi:protein-S-isoprenylcysteine O-methyltransferase Ste14